MTNDAATQKAPLAFSDLLAVLFAAAGLAAGEILLFASPEAVVKLHGAILAAGGVIFLTLTCVFGANSGAYSYNVIKAAVIAAMVWGLAALLAGNFIALQLAFPALNFDLPWTSFGRLRPLHTATALFAFAGNALMASSFYAVQRSCQAKLSGRFAPWFVWIGYNAMLVIAGTGYILGIGLDKEYAGQEWYAGPWFLPVWIVYLFVFLGTIWRGKDQRPHVANWFFLVFIVALGAALIASQDAVPVPLLGSKSYSLAAGVLDALSHWWYSHNGLAFFVTAGFLGVMYFFVPARAGRPIFSNTLATVHVLALCAAVLVAPPLRLHYVVLPDWLQTFAVAFPVALWLGCVAGMANGLMTMNGAWGKLRTDPVIRFLVFAVAIKLVDTYFNSGGWHRNSLHQYTDWTPRFSHFEVLGWWTMMTFGAIYSLVPWIWKRNRLYSIVLAKIHFWLAVTGVLLYGITMWIVSIMEYTRWNALDKSGMLLYSFVDTVQATHPQYIARAFGGAAFTLGALIMIYNLWMTVAAQPAEAEDAALRVPRSPAG